MMAFACPSIRPWFTRLAITAVGLLIPISLHAAAGDLDCTFGDGGILDLSLGSVGTYDAVQLSDGKIVAMGSSPGSLRFSRFLADGDLDSAFGVGGSTTFALANAFALALAVDSMDRLVVVGELTTGGDSEVWVARFTSAGAADTSFGGGDGWTSFDWTAATSTDGVDSGDAIAVDSSDRPVVGGWTDAGAMGSQLAVARLTSAGALDSTFGSGGLTFASSPGSGQADTLSSLKIDGSGRIVAIGSTTFAPPLQFLRDTILARWTDVGGLDTTFDGDGVLVLDMAATGGTDHGFDLDFDSTGRILALSAGSLPLIARLSASGVLDPTFDGDGLVQQTFLGSPNQVTSLLVQADDKPLVIGWPRVGPSFHLASMRLTLTGALDTSWGTTGVVTTVIGPSEVARAAFLKPDQRLVVVGSSSGNLVMARYLNDTSTVTNTATTITSDLPDPSMVGTGVTVGVSVAATSGAAPPTGTVTVGDGVDSCALGLTPAGSATASGSCSLVLSAAGSRTLTATYQSDGSFCSSSGIEPHEVTLTAGATTATSITGNTPDPSVVGQAVTVSFAVSSASPGSPSGNVTVSDGVDSCVGTVAVGSCSVAFTTVGTRLLTATYSGNGVFAGSTSAPQRHLVNPAPTATTITSDLPDPSVVGQLVAVSFTVAVNAPGAGTPTGTVTVSDGVDSCSATAAAGTCAMTFTTPGLRSLTATYSGNGTFTGSVSTPQPHQVNSAPTTITITSDLPDPSVVGQLVAVSFTVAVNAPGAGTPAGTVTISDGVDSCSATVAAGTCVVALTTQGARSLTAAYGGNGTFAGSISAPQPHQVNSAPTTTSIISDLPDPSVVGQVVTVDYRVAVNAPGAGTPTGTVTVSDGADSCSTTVGAGSCTLAFSTVGDRLLTATYSGDAAFAESVSTDEPHQVDRATTSTTITADSPDPSAVGQLVTVAYTVEVDAPGAGTPTGNVTVSDGVDSCSATVVDGSCTLAFSTAGARSLNATYSGDAAFVGSASATEPHQVNRATTSTAITADSPDPSAVNQLVTVAYTVEVDAPGDGTPTGNVTVSDGVDTCSANVIDGSCALAFSNVGDRLLTATYSGDTAFAGSVSVDEPHQVGRATTATTLLSHNPDPSVFGQAITVVYSVTSIAPGTPSGDVTVSDGVDACTGTTAAGSCALTLSSVGDRSLTVTYEGDSLFGESSDSAEHTVEEAATATTILSLEPNPAGVGSEVEVRFAVDTLPPGAGSPTGAVFVDDGAGNGCSAPILEAGCSFVVPGPGRFTITAMYPGDGSYGPSQGIADEELLVQGLPVIEVPTSGEVGLLLFALLLAIAALPMLRRT